MSAAEDIRPPEVRLGPRSQRMEPLWDRVERNRLRLAGTVFMFAVGTVVGIDGVVVLLALPVALFTSLLGTGGQAAALLGRIVVWTSVLSAAVAFGWTAVALTRSERWLVRRLGATISPKGESLPTKMALKDMALAAGITPAPATYLLESQSVNAFVFAASRRRPIVGVTRGLVERLSVDEQRAVFANLIARLRSGDTIYATGLTALTRPLWTMRDRELRRSAEKDSAAMFSERVEERPVEEEQSMVFGWLFFVAAAFVAVTEIAAFGSRRSQLRQAEVADAEGMLLLREPKAMLSALESCIRFDNYVPTAGPAFGQLFYCWTGDSTNDEEDPEWRRVTRLREVLGIEGLVRESAPTSAFMPIAPVAPRLED
jgi:Zn-dependent protease with chaperone function